MLLLRNNVAKILTVLFEFIVIIPFLFSTSESFIAFKLFMACYLVVQTVKEQQKK
jgi:uncharacterized membrane protein